MKTYIVPPISDVVDEWRAVQDAAFIVFNALLDLREFTDSEGAQAFVRVLNAYCHLRVRERELGSRWL